MKVEIYADTANDAFMFKMILYHGLLNVPNWLKDEIKQHPELDTKIDIFYHIKENEKKTNA